MVNTTTFSMGELIMVASTVLELAAGLRKRHG